MHHTLPFRTAKRAGTLLDNLAFNKAMAFPRRQMLLFAHTEHVGGGAKQARTKLRGNI
jgi:hypothetical protein